MLAAIAASPKAALRARLSSELLVLFLSFSAAVLISAYLVALDSAASETSEAEETSLVTLGASSV